MRSSVNRTFFAATIAAFAIGAFCAVSSTSPLAADKDQVIKDRQTFMKDQGRQWLLIRNYVQGKADQAAAIAAADALTKSVSKVPDYFPPDSGGPAPGGKWGTKPEIWSDHDKFLAADKKVADQVAELDAAVKSGDTAKVAAAFKDLDGCAACHQDFRAKLQ
jgi:cytochrome c556